MPAKKSATKPEEGSSKKIDSAKETRKPKIKAPKATKAFSSKSLVASVSATSVAASVDVTFSSGIGQLTTSLFRAGVLINLQSVSSSASIALSDVQRGDTISVNGVCTGSATISISVDTDPSTPEEFGAGNINTGYDIL